MLFCGINWALFFFFTSLAYRFFTVDSKKNLKIIVDASSTKSTTQTERTEGGVFGNKTEGEIKSEGDTPPVTATVPEERRTSQERLSRYSFNIFDGTNATGQFSDFIYAGDSDDENADDAETMYWGAVQNHV